MKSMLFVVLLTLLAGCTQSPNRYIAYNTEGDLPPEMILRLQHEAINVSDECKAPNGNLLEDSAITWQTLTLITSCAQLRKTPESNYRVNLRRSFFWGLFGMCETDALYDDSGANLWFDQSRKVLFGLLWESHFFRFLDGQRHETERLDRSFFCGLFGYHQKNGRSCMRLFAWHIPLSYLPEKQEAEN